MRWVGLAAEGLMAICGVVILLYAYRLIGKPPGADEKYDAAMSRQAGAYRIMGWCIVIMAIIALLDHLLGGLL
jgi:hypothetical protein